MPQVTQATLHFNTAPKITLQCSTVQCGAVLQRLTLYWQEEEWAAGKVSIIPGPTDLTLEPGTEESAEISHTATFSQIGDIN